MSVTPVLQISDLTVGLPPGGERRAAVEGVSLAVAPGEIVCLIGELGSGKSVIAQSVMGLLPAALPRRSGSIRLDGEEIAGLDEARLRQLRGRRMSMIFQEPMTALNPVMSCGRQVEEVLATHGERDPAKRRAISLDMLARVGMPDPARVHGSYPHQLSGGQRQRVMIAMALALRPSLLIADEPTTALDVTTQARILALIKDVQRERGMGVLFITHDFGVVSDIADRVAVLRLGTLVELGAMRDVLARPRHDYTRSLIAAVPSLTPRTAQRAPDAPVALRTERLTKVYRGGGLFHRGHSVLAVDGVSLTVKRGETLGIVGEFGLGKVDRRALHRAPRRAERGARLARRQRDRDAVAAPPAAAPPPHPDCLPGPLPLAQPPPSDRRVDHRRPDEFRREPQRGARARRGPPRAGASRPRRA